jgi:hypothetical protein
VQAECWWRLRYIGLGFGEVVDDRLAALVTRRSRGCETGEGVDDGVARSGRVQTRSKECGSGKRRRQVEMKDLRRRVGAQGGGRRAAGCQEKG